MATTDLRKHLKDLYDPSAREVTTVQVPRMNFLMIDGMGDPNTAASYQEAVEALYAASYSLKFMVKKGPQAIDYAVMPIEGLWWTEDGGPPDFERKDTWNWTAMMMQPDFITSEQVAAAIEQARKKRDLPGRARIRFAPFQEGTVAQILYVGPYAAEQPSIERLHAFITGHGHRLTGKHHEIYLSDPRRTAPERLKTLIRQPFADGLQETV